MLYHLWDNDNNEKTQQPSSLEVRQIYENCLFFVWLSRGNAFLMWNVGLCIVLVQLLPFFLVFTLVDFKFKRYFNKFRLECSFMKENIQYLQCHQMYSTTLMTKSCLFYANMMNILYICEIQWMAHLSMHQFGRWHLPICHHEPNPIQMKSDFFRLRNEAHVSRQALTTQNGGTLNAKWLKAPSNFY